MWLVVVILLAALLSSGSAAPPVLGFVVGLVLGLMAIYRLAWNARGDYDAEAAKRKIDDGNKAGRM
jgi:hypothetical protein